MLRHQCLDSWLFGRGHLSHLASLTEDAHIKCGSENLRVERFFLLAVQQEGFKFRDLLLEHHLLRLDISHLRLILFDEEVVLHLQLLDP
jgi:hypothetical protein